MYTTNYSTKQSKINYNPLVSYAPPLQRQLPRLSTVMEHNYDNFIYIHFLKHHSPFGVYVQTACVSLARVWVAGAKDVEQEIVKVSMVLCPTVMQICDGL